MLYSQDAGVLFLEVPKTGSVALSKGLKGVCRQMRELPRHLSAHRARAELGSEKWDQIDTLAVIREPSRWLQSWYRYTVGKGRVDSELPFASFVKLVAENGLIDGENIRVLTQFERIADRRGREVIVSELLCFEYLSDEYSRVNNMYLGGSGAPLARSNVSPPLQADISPMLQDLIHSRWDKDYAIWNEVHEGARRRFESNPDAEATNSNRTQTEQIVVRQAEPVPLASGKRSQGRDLKVESNSTHTLTNERVVTRHHPLSPIDEPEVSVSAHKDPVVVFTVGKVGSSSVSDAIDNSDFETLQVHVLGQRVRERAELRPQVRHLQASLRVLELIEAEEAIKFVSLFREPVSRNVSAFFQNFAKLVGGDVEQLNVNQVQNLICETVPPHQTQQWIEDELAPVTGVDVSRHRLFDGPAVAAEAKWPTLLLRSDCTDSMKSAAIGNFLDDPELVVKRDSNVTAAKAGGRLSQQIKKLGLPANYVDECLSQPFVATTWTPAEIEATRQKWTEST